MSVEIIIPDDVTEIADGAYEGRTDITGVILPYSNVNTGGRALDITGLLSITVPDVSVKIGARAFKDCKALQSITVSFCVVSIGEDAFCGCEALQDVDISPESWEKFKDSFADTPYGQKRVQQEQQEQSEKWAEEGFCRFCGGNVGLFKKCKNCNEKN